MSSADVWRLSHEAIAQTRSPAALDSKEALADQLEALLASREMSTESVQTHDFEVALESLRGRGLALRSAPLHALFGGQFHYLEHFARQADFGFAPPEHIAAAYVLARTHPADWRRHLEAGLQHALDERLVKQIDAHIRCVGAPTPLELTEMSQVFLTFMRPTQRDVNETSEATKDFIDDAIPRVHVAAPLAKRSSNINRQYRAAMCALCISALPSALLESALAENALGAAGTLGDDLQKMTELVLASNANDEALAMMVRSFKTPASTRASNKQ